MRLLRTIPYAEGGGLADEIRALAGQIGDADARFAELRFKIHAMLEPGDADAVDRYADRSSATLAEQARSLATKIRTYYSPATRLEQLEKLQRRISDGGTRSAIDAFLQVDRADIPLTVRAGVRVLVSAEKALIENRRSRYQDQNLYLLHAMSLIDEASVGLTSPMNDIALSRQEGLELALMLVHGARAVGMLSPRESDTAAEALAMMQTGTQATYLQSLDRFRRVLDWARAKVLAEIGLALRRYVEVEPRSANVVDDMLRSSVMLPLATLINRLVADAEGLRGGNRLVGGSGILRGREPGCGHRSFTGSQRRDESRRPAP